MYTVKFSIGTSLDNAIRQLKEESEKRNEVCIGDFNGKPLYSTDSIDDAYIRVIGSTKDEVERRRKESLERIERERAEHESKIPALTEEYRQRARGLVIDETLKDWDKVVPIRLSDLYRGMELEQTLQICAIMRDESVPYDKRLRKAYDLFMESGHSGMSASLTASMISMFCPYGTDVADAVKNFRFEQKR